MNKITNDYYNYLPVNIKESTVLSEDAKKVLAALMNWSENSQASETGIIIISNQQLRKLSGIKQNNLMTAIIELKIYKLITREKGKPRVEGERSIASKYTIDYDALEKPLKRFTYKDRLKMNTESSSNPDGYCNYNGNYNCNYNGNYNPNLNPNPNCNNNANLNPNDIKEKDSYNISSTVKESQQLEELSSAIVEEHKPYGNMPKEDWKFLYT